jgi:hypothetical protein
MAKHFFARTVCHGKVIGVNNVTYFLTIPRPLERSGNPGTGAPGGIAPQGLFECSNIQLITADESFFEF